MMEKKVLEQAFLRIKDVTAAQFVKGKIRKLVGNEKGEDIVKGLRL
jgi:rRNA biogenesis protein RRP5